MTKNLNIMKAKTFIFAMMMVGIANAQTDVTDTYMQNPDFDARYAGWLNEGTTKGAVGGFTHQTNSSFSGKSGEIYMEKYVSSGSKVSNCNISQVLQNVPVGTYMLTVAAQNTQNSNGSGQTGAYVFAGDEQTEVSEYADYSVTFSVIDGKVKVGFKTVSATGNWVCFDNFRLYQLDTDMDAVHAQLQTLIDEATEALGDGSGNTASELQDAIEVAEGFVSASTTEGVQDAAIALERATLNYRISNGTGSVPTVETNPFVAMGVTIALGRSTITNNGATISEQGFCWSTDPEPTVLDNRTTEYFTNNGRVYRMENLEPATFYYVRAYAMTDEWQVGYGDVVKIATKPKGTVSFWYNYGGDTEQNYRINSSFEECVWMYNNITHITGFSISASYSAGTSTADCSYGGSMRIGPSSSYQQTGTILHETNHGVGVGTTNEWYNNSNLRSNTSTGDWLGSCANEMVQFLQNDEGAYMTGDTQHMWGTTTTSGASMKNWGINGANEDSYSPADQLLYWGNIFLTHALHIDGLPCSSSVGFASPAYVFEQRDDVKYYIKSEDETYGEGKYLSVSNTGALRNVAASVEEATQDDDLAWYITFNPSTGYYTFYNVGTGRYIGVSNSSLRGTTSATTIHLIPSHKKVTEGDFSKHSYWITNNKGSYTLRAGSSSCSTTSINFADDATAQRWLLLTAEELSAYESGEKTEKLLELDELLAHVRETQAVPHEATSEQVNIDQVDNDLEVTLSSIEAEKDGYTTSEEIEEAITTVQDALMDFLTYVKPSEADNPFDLSYLFVNMSIDNTEGWSDTPTLSYSCMEYWTTSSFDFNQTSSLKLPVGTYQLCAQAFQRPGEYSTVYTDYMQNGVNNVNATLYAGSASALIKNMYDDYQTTSLGSGCVAAAANVYVPNDMYSASLYFAKGLYENSVEVTTTSKATLKIGLKASKPSSTEHYWTIFDNFRLYFLGGSDDEEITPVNTVVADESAAGSGTYFDLSGRQVSSPTRGIYIQKGKKVLVK